MIDKSSSIPSQSQQIRQGIVQFYLEDKGYGYIRDLATREEFHFTKKVLLTTIKDKDRVVFAVGESKQGLFAKNVRVI
ncbi:MAG: cold shock domain-containing protein [Bacteroidota bacterium]